MGSTSAGSAPARDAHTHPPALPEVHDEAGDTPLWLPALGAALLALAGLFLVFRAALADTDAAPEAPAAAEAAPAGE